MNRLFWKILIALWLTLLAAALGLALALQVYQPLPRGIGLAMHSRWFKATS